MTAAIAIALILAVAALGIWLNRGTARRPPPCGCGPEECEGWGAAGFTCARQKETTP